MTSDNLPKECTSIAVFTNTLHTGGVERVAVDLCQGFVDHNYSVDLVLADASGDLLTELPDEVNIIDLGADRVLQSILPLRRYISSREPKILYSMMTGPNLISIAAGQSVQSQTKIIISEHNMMFKTNNSVKDQMIAFATWSCYPLANHVVAVSEGVSESVYNRTRLSKDKISTIYNPVQVELIKKKGAEPINHNWFNNDDIDVVLSGGRHESQKGFDTLLESFRILSEDNHRLVIFGTGSETKKLELFAEELGISDRVLFTGFVENPYQYMSAADVFVLSSRYEGFGLVLVEAMACGCPVVSTNCNSGPSEILKNGKYGLLVPVGDTKSLAQAIEYALKNPLDSDILIQRAFDFSEKNIIDNYNMLFNRILE